MEVSLICALALLAIVGIISPERVPDVLGLRIPETGTGALTVVGETAGTMLALFGAALLFGLETYRQSYGSRYWEALSTSLNLRSLIAYHLLCLVASFAAFGLRGSGRVYQSILLADLAVVLLAISVTKVVAAAHRIIVEPRQLVYLDEVLYGDGTYSASKIGEDAHAGALSEDTISYFGEAAQLAVLRHDDYALDQVLERSWDRVVNVHDSQWEYIRMMTRKPQSPFRIDCNAYAQIMESALRESRRSQDAAMIGTILRHVRPVLECVVGADLDMVDAVEVIHVWQRIVRTAISENWSPLLVSACPIVDMIVTQRADHRGYPPPLAAKWLARWSRNAALSGNLYLLVPLLNCETRLVRAFRESHTADDACALQWFDFLRTLYDSFGEMIDLAMQKGIDMSDLRLQDSLLSPAFFSESVVSIDNGQSCIEAVYLDIAHHVLAHAALPATVQEMIESVVTRLQDNSQGLGQYGRALIVTLQETYTSTPEGESGQHDRVWATKLLKSVYDAAVDAEQVNVVRQCEVSATSMGARLEDC